VDVALADFLVHPDPQPDAVLTDNIEMIVLLDSGRSFESKLKLSALKLGKISFQNRKNLNKLLLLA
jgi:hypothetical protein